MTEQDAAAIAESLRQALQTHACEAHRKGMENYFTTQMAFLGVRTPLLRKEVRALAAALRKESGELVIDVARQLTRTGVFEERQAAYELLAKHKGAMALLDRTRLEELGTGNDNWASVDTLACLLAGPRWLQGALADRDIDQWLRSQDLWWRRTAVVCTTTLNKKSHGGTGDADRTFAVLSPVLEERHPMLVKAVSWALRQLAPWAPERVERFLEAHEKELAPQVKREVRSKLTTGRKNPRHEAGIQKQGR